MKYNILIPSLLFTLSFFAQKGNTPYTQKEWLERAQKSIAASNRLNTLASYYYAYTEDSGTPEGKNALRKSDSIKQVMQDKIMSELQGQWKLTSSGSNWGYTNADDQIQNILVITGKDAVFSEVNLNNGESKILREEKLVFVQPSSSNYGYYHVMDFLYSDNKVWNFHVNEKNILHIIYVGDFLSGNINEMVCGSIEYHYIKMDY